MLSSDSEVCPWIDWAIELQFLAQSGLFYSKDPYDKERFLRIREIAAEMLAYKGQISQKIVEGLFCNEVGFQTPKLDTRAAIIEDNKIILVKETTGRWALPGGWVDVNQSIRSNTIKEVKEEAGLEVLPVRLIALHDKDLHNTKPHAYKICKVFVLCQKISGQFMPNLETVESRYFDLQELVNLELATEKNTYEQIALCFQAYHDENWQPIFD